MKEFHTIFNNALAPITPGPSSSNTCGPIRIGRICNRILGGVPAKVRVEYYSGGAFVTTLYGMKSDIAYVNGILGKEQNAPDFKDGYENAEKAGMEISFAMVDDLTVGGSEVLRSRMTAQDGTELSVIGESLGGGAVRMHFIDDCPVNIDGTSYELVVFLKEPSREAAEKLKAEMENRIGHLNGVSVSCGSRYAIVNVKSGVAIPEEMTEELKARPEVLRVRTIEPVHPEVCDMTREVPFEDGKGFAAYCEEKGCSPARAAIDYEMAASGWTEEQVRSYCDMLIGIMKDSLEGGYREDLRFDGIVEPKARGMRGRIGTGRMPSLGLLNTAIPAALSVMEHSNAAGKIVCVPTGGSSGIVPGLLLSAADQMGLDGDALYEAMMTAGMIGVLMMVDGNEFNGGMNGCQAEIACGTAMAAAGLVQMIGGTAQNVCDAASMSLQSLLGLICDPVAGLVQVPCLARNMAAVSIAATAAEAVCAGFEVVIPFDEMTATMVRVGREIAAHLGFCCNGCIMTDTAQRLTCAYNKKMGLA